MAGDKVSKADIVESIYPSVKVSKKNIRRIIDMFIDEVKKGLVGDMTIELRGLGTFEVRTRKGRRARNPKTGESVMVRNHGVAHFRPGKELKRRVWDIRH